MALYRSPKYNIALTEADLEMKAKIPTETHGEYINK